MISPEEWMDIKDLYRQGVSLREIARRTGHSRNTIAKLVQQKTPQPFQKRTRRSCLDPYKPYLQERYRAYGLSSVRLLEEIRAQGYSGSLDVVQRYIKQLKQQITTAAKATVRFETAPGQQAQADWAHVGEDAAGKIYAFICVLGFSRMLFVTFTRSMQLPELIRCHQEAFDYFGGVPESILFDNMAQVKHGETLNPLFADFAAHYGFSVRTHRPYRPRTKGKVERMVDYLKDNFLNGRTFAGFSDLCTQGRLWQESANSRVHATTGERPLDLWPREKLAPIALVAPYVVAQRHDRRVDVEGYVRLAHARYSVPPEHVGQRVLVVAEPHRIQVRLGETIIAEHLPAPPGSCITEPTHLEAMRQQTLEKIGVPQPKVTFSEENAVATPSLTLYEEVTHEPSV